MNPQVTVGTSPRRSGARSNARRWNVVAALILLTAGGAPAQARRVADEHDLKAAFVLNFVRFVEWPSESLPDPQTPLQVCILPGARGDSNLERAIQGKLLQNREIRLQRLKDPALLAACHVLILSGDSNLKAHVLKHLPNASVLTIGDASEDARLTGVITMVMEENRLRFDVDLHAAEKARLRVSSKLLTLARRVQLAYRVSENR